MLWQLILLFCWIFYLIGLDKLEALEILEEIKENVNTCCAITMEPDEVLVLLDKLESYINDTTGIWKFT